LQLHTFIVDDKKVLNEESVTDRLELNFGETGGFGWLSTSKRPLINEQGEIIGMYGVSRHLGKTSKTLSKLDAIEVPAKFVRNNYDKEITIKMLANVAHLSVSAL